MRRMAQLYGGELVLIDATHKVLKYKTPQFMLAVPTNCGYQVSYYMYKYSRPLQYRRSQD